MSTGSLLPKNAESFADSTYWRQFFKQRGEKVFEWYGSYKEIGRGIEKYLKPNDRILQIGCGNSTLADDLYDNGFRRVVSVDIVEDVIKRQKEKNAVFRPELEFHVADITKPGDQNDQLQSGSYQVVLDKGTLDALLPPDSSRKQEETVKGMLEEAHRVLAIGGRYVIVTLAQPEVVRLWVLTFLNAADRSYILRVHQLNQGHEGSSGGWRLPTFLLIATKLKPPADGKSVARQMYDYLDPNAVPRRLTTPEELLEAVKSAQEYSIFCDKAKAKDLLEDLQIDLHGSDSTLGPRYTIHVTTADRKQKYVHPYAVFVVPQGREHEWLFSTPKGRKELCSQASARRLAVVCLGRDHDFLDMETVKSELNERVLDFAPADIGTRDVPYLSLGEDLGQREVIFRGESGFSGDYVVEEVTCGRGKDQTLWRRLVFLKSQNLIQSEAKLQKRSAKTTRPPIDWSHLACAHHRIMLASLAALDNTKTISVCLLGLGGGCLATFIVKHFPEVHLTTVELDPAIVEAAYQYFEFPKTDPKINCLTNDALAFTESTSESNGHFDVILLDVAGPSHVDGMSCPLPAFVTDDCLSRLFKILHPHGVLAFNLVTRDAEKRADVSKAISRHFPHVLRQNVEGELNEVLLCFSETRSHDWMIGFEKRMHSVCTKVGMKCELKGEEKWDIQKLLEKLASL